MTPEDRLKNLKKADRWTVNEVAPRPGAVPDRSPARFVLPAVGGLLALAAAGALVFGAVSLRADRGDPAVTTPTASASPTATPSATPLSTVSGYAAPARTFGSDCTRVASTAKMTDAMGASAKPGNSLLTGAESGQDPANGYVGTASTETWAFAVRQSGGLDCTWVADPQTVVNVLVFPQNAVAPVTAETCGAVPQSESGSHETDCAVAVTANNTTFVGTVSTPNHDISLAIAKMVVPVWTASAEAWEPIAFDPASGTWPLDVDCSAASVADVDGAAWTLETTRNFGDSGPSDVVSGIIGGHPALYCTMASTDAPTGVPDSLYASVYGGGAWVFDASVKDFGATPVEVPGFDHAAILHSPDGQDIDYLLLTRGPNLLAVRERNLDGTAVADIPSTYGVAKAVADALDALTK